MFLVFFSESTYETTIEKYPLFLDSSWTPGDSARMKYGLKPGFGPYFICTLSPGVQLQSKNGGYFFIGILRVDFETEILKMKFLFLARVFGEFWYPPAQGWPVSRIWAEIFTAQKEIGFHAENGFKMYHSWVGRIPTQNPPRK